MSDFEFHACIFLAAVGIIIGVVWSYAGARVGLLVLAAFMLVTSLMGMAKAMQK